MELVVRVAILLAMVGCAGPRFPPPVTKAVRDAAGGVEVRIDGEWMDGQYLYVGRWVRAGRGYKAFVTAQGRLVELEQELADHEVPAKVRAYAVDYFVDTGEASYVKLLAGYRARGMIWGQEMYLHFATDGTFVRTEEGEIEEQEE